jgi:hypothetical protein
MFGLPHGAAVASAAVVLSHTDTLVLADFADSSGAGLQRPLREALRAALDESPDPSRRRAAKARPLPRSYWPG